jgi:glycerophosphoryl diester phosphodiesterase
VASTSSGAAWPWSFLRIAHRGTPGRAPENSLRGFMLAMTLGADMVETDLRVTADGALVLAHDDVVKVPGRQPVQIARTTLATLRRFALDGEPPATLSEALDLRHHGAPLAFNLDIKTGVTARALVRALRAAGRREGILLTGHAPGTFTAVRAAERWVCAALTCSAGRRTAPARALARALPMPGGLVLGRHLADTARRARVRALTLEHPLATPETVRVCHHAGLHVLVWTVDDPGHMRALRAAGVGGITTNRVDLLAALDTHQGL